MTAIGDSKILTDAIGRQHSLAKLNSTTRRTYHFIISHKRENDGLSPTVAEMIDGCNLKSTSHVIRILDQLEAAGLIHRVLRSSRGVMIIGGRWLLDGD